LRGGSWNNNGRNARSANRNDNAPENRNNNLGFRPASTLPQWVELYPDMSEQVPTHNARAATFTDVAGVQGSIHGPS
jgi:hypothetical protein